MIKLPSLCGLDEAIYSDENLIISDSKLNELLPQVQLISKQIRYLCRCESFVLEKSLQYSLNLCILKHIICLEQLAESRFPTSFSGLFG